MQNGYPRHLQNFQLRYPLAGIEWYSSRLDRGSRPLPDSLKGQYLGSSDLMMEQCCQIERYLYLPSVLFSTRVIQFYRVIMSDHTEECLDLQTRQSLATKLLSGILSLIFYARLETGHSPVEENGLGLSYGVIERL